MVECDTWRSGLYLTHSPHLTPYNKHMNKNETNFDRFSFASLTGRAGQPMDFDGDFDDHFTADDIDRRRYETERRRARYGY